MPVLLLDRLAYRFLARFDKYTPEMHYELRRRMLETYGRTCADNMRPYWWSLLRARLLDLRDTLFP